LGGVEELAGLLEVAQVQGVVAHAGQHVRAQGPIAGVAGQLEGQAEVTAGRSVVAGVVGHHPGPTGQHGRDGEQLASYSIGVAAVQQWRDFTA
jgi:hypothetical protein